MSIYNFREESTRRRILRGGYVPFEHKKCSCGVLPRTPENRKKYVKLIQGSFVSNVLWSLLLVPHVSEELMEALQKEKFEGIAFEPTEIVTDARPSRDRKKLPLNQIPPFYRVKCLTSIPLHPDFIELHEIRFCPECGALNRKSPVPDGPIILDGKRHPGTDFFRIVVDSNNKQYASFISCTERGKTFLENYPKTYCTFHLHELRD